MQNIWETDLGWDDEINDKQFETWKNWQSKFAEISMLKITRILTNFPLDKSDVQLHIFCDASIYAYSAVA